MTSPTALVAEDEPLLALALQTELTAAWPALRIVSVAPNGPAALHDLLALTPDIAFLDVRMPGLSGIEVAQALAEDWTSPRPPPLIVFVTAFEHFAIDAFEQSAVDYLLKPVQADRLAISVARLQSRLAERAAKDTLSDDGAAAPDGLAALAAQVRQFLGSPPAPAVPPLRLIRAAVGDVVRMIRVDDVVYLQAADKYVNVVTARGEALIRESLRDLLPQLDPSRFVQIHRGTVVNIDQVSTVVRGDGGRLLLTLHDRPERLTVSRVYSHLFRPM